MELLDVAFGHLEADRDDLVPHVASPQGDPPGPRPLPDIESRHDHLRHPPCRYPWNVLLVYVPLYAALQEGYLDEAGVWRTAKSLTISPPLDLDNSQWLKGSWIDHALSFEPVETTAIRIIGDAGGIDQDERNGGERRYYTAISELAVYSD